MTALEMAGVSITLFSLSEQPCRSKGAGVLEYLDAVTDAPAWVPSADLLESKNTCILEYYFVVPVDQLSLLALSNLDVGAISSDSIEEEEEEEVQASVNISGGQPCEFVIPLLRAISEKIMYTQIYFHIRLRNSGVNLH